MTRLVLQPVCRSAPNPKPATPNPTPAQTQDLQPCNVALVNVWKSASYSAGVASAIIIILAHIMGSSRFPEASLLPVLIITWLGLAMGRWPHGWVDVAERL